MSTTRREATKILCNYLATQFDGFLAKEGFNRRERSLEYSRPVDAGTQFLNMYFALNPSSDPRAIALVLPQIRLIFPELNQQMLEIQPMMGDMPILSDGVNGVTVNEQIQNAAPREVRSGTWWFIYDDESARACLASIRDFILQWTSPFLNKYTTVVALTKGYEEQDECLPHDRRFLLFIIAAYTLLEQPAKAMEVLETKMGRPGARRQYAKAFEYVANLLKDARAGQVDKTEAPR